MSLTGLKDVDREILKHADDEDLLKICAINRKTWNSVCDDAFLRRRLSKYPGIEKYKKENESWKQFFLKFIYYIAKMKEKFQFQYTYGDFRKQYKLLDKYEYDENSLLIASSRKGELPLMKFAIEKGADIHTEEDLALKHAAWQGHLDAVRYLVENGADIHDNEDEPLRQAAEYGHLDVVKYLVEHGADIHAEDDFALRYASLHGYLDLVKYLVENGVDASNIFAIKYASSSGHLDVVKYLIENGADPHEQYDAPLRLAIEGNHTEVVKYLQSLK